MTRKMLTGFGLVITVIVIIILVLSIYRGAKSTYKDYLSEVEDNFNNMPAQKQEIITNEDLADLPLPVRNYLQYAGVIGTPKAACYSVNIDGEFKMSKNSDWASVEVEQFSFIQKPARLFYMKLKLMGLTIFGFHHYESAKASMVIKILDLFTVADVTGPEMDKGETVTVFNDMCILAPSSLIDPRIEWTPIDELTAAANFTNGDITINATLYFNKKGELINFISDDRYYLGKNNELIPYRWETPVGGFREINGLKLAGYGEAFWIQEDGPFCYAKFNILDVTINP